MKHRFYSKSKKEQNRIQVIIAICAIAFILPTIVLFVKTDLYLIGILISAILLSIIAPFFDTPSLKKSGKLIYYSPLFVTEKPKNGIIKIHGGSLFDYFYVIDRKMNGKQRTNFIIQNYLQGLLCLMEEYEDIEKTDFKIRGTSYIMNKRTAERLGFTVIKTDFLQKLVLLYNYFNLMISNSIAKKRIAFPNLKETKTFEANFSQLIERKDYIAKLNNSLKITIADKGDKA